MIQTEDPRARLTSSQQQVRRKPNSAVAHFNLGLAYSQSGLMSRAEQSYRRALEIDPDIVEAWVNLGGTLLLQWDFEGSLEANRRAIDRRDDVVEAHYNSGQASLYLDDAENLVKCNRKVLDLDPSHAAGHYFLAVGLLALNRIEESRQALAQAMRLGYRPSPEFLRGLERAQQNLQSQGPRSITIGVDDSDESKED